MSEMDVTLEEFQRRAAEYCRSELEAVKSDKDTERDWKKELVDAYRVAEEILEDDDHVDIEHLQETLVNNDINDDGEPAERVAYWELLGFRWGLFTMANCRSQEDINPDSEEFLQHFASEMQGFDAPKEWRKNWGIITGNFLKTREEQTDFDDEEALDIVEADLKEHFGDEEWEDGCWCTVNFLRGYTAAINLQDWDFEEEDEGGSGETDDEENSDQSSSKMKQRKANGKVPPALEIIENPGITFADVVGMDEAKQDLEYNIKLLENPKLQKEHDVQAIGGILLHGPPGTGKTFFAKAAAGQFKKKFFSVNASELQSQWHGESEKNIKAIFDFARKNTPCILFFDEFDTLAMRRDNLGNAAWLGGQVNQLLQQLDGIKKGTGKHPIVIAATNYLDRIDPAARRPGRFDTLVFVPPMTKEARLVLLQNETKKRKLAADVDLAKLAAAMDGWTPAEIKGTVDAVKRNILKESKGGAARPISMTDIRPEFEKMAQRKKPNEPAPTRKQK